MKIFLLKDIKHEYSKENLNTWKFIDISKSSRLYFEPLNSINLNGFYFYAVKQYGSYSNKKSDDWNPELTFVECLFQGIAYYDGVRHLYMGDDQTDNYGYHYYPNLSDLTETLIKLQELEQKYCQEK